VIFDATGFFRGRRRTFGSCPDLGLQLTVDGQRRHPQIMPSSGYPRATWYGAKDDRSDWCRYMFVTNVRAHQTGQMWVIIERTLTTAEKRLLRKRMRLLPLRMPMQLHCLRLGYVSLSLDPERGGIATTNVLPPPYQKAGRTGSRRKRMSLRRLTTVRMTPPSISSAIRIGRTLKTNKVDRNSSHN
jgi:hypothetical protein